MKRKLTKSVVEGLKPEPDGDLVVWDTAVPCFGVRVKPSGTRSYVVQYRNDGGRSRKVTLGRHGHLTLQEARARAKALLCDVAGGEDPAEVRDRTRSAPTLSELGERYMDEHARPHKKPVSADRDQRILERDVLPVLGRRRAADITPSDIGQLHHKMRATPFAANRALALLSKVFNLAEAWGLRPAGSNPCRHVKRFREEPRERFLTAAEFEKLGEVLAGAAANGTEHSSVLLAIRLLMLTGCRRGEILTLRWDYVDVERTCLRLPDSKTGKKVVPLSPEVLALLTGADRHGSVWVCPGMDPEKPWNNLSKPWARIRTAAGLGDVRLHDLRHSYAAMAAAGGLSLPMIGALLGHHSAQTTKRYAHLADDPLREAAGRVGRSVAAALGGGRPMLRVVGKP